LGLLLLRLYALVKLPNVSDCIPVEQAMDPGTVVGFVVGAAVEARVLATVVGFVVGAAVEVMILAIVIAFVGAGVVIGAGGGEQSPPMAFLCAFFPAPEVLR